MNTIPVSAASSLVSPTDLRSVPPVPVRPAQRPSSRPAAAVLQRNAGFGQLSLDLRRTR
jgi:hypothetical protein